MNNEYIIVSKTAIQKRIEELHYYYGGIRPADEPFYAGELSALKELISQSTPLIPEIEKAFDAGGVFCFNVNIENKYDGDKNEYISKLKLDI